jgi:hypothetical protein
MSAARMAIAQVGPDNMRTVRPRRRDRRRGREKSGNAITWSSPSFLSAPLGTTWVLSLTLVSLSSLSEPCHLAFAVLPTHSVNTAARLRHVASTPRPQNPPALPPQRRGRGRHDPGRSRRSSRRIHPPFQLRAASSNSWSGACVPSAATGGSALTAAGASFSSCLTRHPSHEVMLERGVR